MKVRVARCDPQMLDFVTWAVLKGCRMFQRVHTTRMGLVSTQAIQAYDFVAVVPTSATLSLLTVSNDLSFPLKVSPASHGNKLEFWDDLTLGSFSFVAYLAKALQTGQPRGIRSYLDVLPVDHNMPIGRVADAGQMTRGYREMAAPLRGASGSQATDFDGAFRHAYCLFRRHGIPFWSHTEVGGTGHPEFQNSPFVESGGGDIIGMVPVIDLASHSPNPNAAIGYPDDDMLQWLAQETRCSVAKDKNYFVMQALRDIQSGEMITVNKNAYFNFDDDAFYAWFGFRNESQHRNDKEEVMVSAGIDRDHVVDS
ncbi:uncharacterized protein TEOVI_000057600 [Trypanosoma equiperdum]|uniref:SET domain-containing protein n=4 Tax=Trypanozoon TaxID=39700 RepID=Q38DP6_TRYB2|nr:hypothetical protein, conserved [Trypanosoma brucei gambiense DAL972]XP_827404.1 hypothetical protein, conserved [Trypanosoma brucei brucei TREU927]RHW70626.1 hypothetical protein DPX39_090066000 [Trypanosoma brucei equiperdum]SCU68930.1 hypothetical protein, conserved [Trypanosoma equiperdum]EAN77074.1 hypothetical protein, conserved [Trypanosoma brucei brucei TREU927]CBH14600.1 hypothetical protein, conserved [Trypanosoma brucei gambiense DAL972]|eukprot:XP_011776866.1 hypothetical protein, conserved [Trypanosoma brucei gambiense DAL972]